MTENKLRNQVISCADGWLGLSEKDGSHKKIIDIYNGQKDLPRGYRLKYTDAWCAAFVTAVGVHLGISQILLPECSVGEMVKLYKKANRFQKAGTYTPKQGDLVVYDWDGSGNGDHIGIVYMVSGKNMTAVEGNYKNAVTLRELKMDSESVLGYCTPNYRTLEGLVDTAKRVQLCLHIFCYAGRFIYGIFGRKTPSKNR